MTEPAPVRVVLADDNPVVRLGLAQILLAEGGVDLVGEAANGRQALDLVQLHRPDVVLLDVRMPVLGGLDVVAEISALAPVLMLTQTDDPDVILSAIARGARGYLLYGGFDARGLVHSVRTVAAGGSVLSPEVARLVLPGTAGPDTTPTAGAPAAGTQAGPGPAEVLSDREQEVMALVAAGLSNADIASRLFLSYKTVKNHLNRIFPKLGVTNRAEAMALWLGARPAAPGAGRRVPR